MFDHWFRNEWTACLTPLGMSSVSELVVHSLTTVLISFRTKRPSYVRSLICITGPIGHMPHTHTHKNTGVRLHPAVAGRITVDQSISCTHL